MQNLLLTLKLKAEEAEELSLAFCKWGLETFFWAPLFVYNLKLILCLWRKLTYTGLDL